LAASDLRVLDSGTANGLFLKQLRSMLAYPDSATLIGTDIAPFEQNMDEPDYIEWHKQDINADWPEIWQGTFDFVHQRAVVSSTGDWYGAAKATIRLARLAKPGGYIQLVDSALPIEEIEEGDPPSLKLMKTLGQFLGSFGLNNHAGDKLDNLLRIHEDHDEYCFNRSKAREYATACCINFPTLILSRHHLKEGFQSDNP
jgi:hypothetical protein